MKKGYKRLLGFEIIVFLILLLNSFVRSILTGYWMFLFLVLLLVIFKFMFGFERDSHRYTKDIIMDTIIYLIIFFILFYLLGIFITFARVDNYYRWYGIKNFIFPVIYTIVFREYLRYMILSKAEGNKVIGIFTCILFILFDVTVSLSVVNFKSNYDTFIFVALRLLPAISSNIVFSLMTLKTGYKPIIFYALVIGLYRYLLPIIPNPDQYLTSIIMFILPIGFGYRVYTFFSKESDDEVERDYNKKTLVPYIIPSVVTVILVYFTSGYFHFHAIAVASGSMEPNIHKGDIAIIEKIEDDYDKLEVGQVIAYKYEGVIVVHRLINILDDRGEYFYYTKGDANKEEDNWVVEKDMIIGIVNHRIPYAGMPTVWLNEL